MVRDNGIPDVCFAGFLPYSKVMDAFAAADIAVLPSESEPWGLVVNEAMNFSLPVVVSDKVGAGYDLISDGLTGFTFASRSLPELTRALWTLLAKPELRRRLGHAALQRVNRQSPDKAAEGVIRAVQTLTKMQ